MPHLELTDREAKLMWLILDEELIESAFPEFVDVEASLFAKVYRAYRGIPEAA